MVLWASFGVLEIESPKRVHHDFFVKLDFEIAVDQQTRACEGTSVVVPDSGCPRDSHAHKFGQFLTQFYQITLTYSKPCFARANFGIRPPKFFEDLNQKFTSRVFFYSKAILKVSCKIIEKWLSYNAFVGIDYANVANGDMRNSVHFLQLFDNIIHS